MLLALGGCGDDSPTEPPPDSVGPAGGTLSFAGGDLMLEFPPGAVTCQVTISVEPATGHPASPRLVGGTAYRLGPEGIRFAEPVLLTIGYDPENIPSVMREGELRLFRAVDAAWQQVAVRSEQGYRVNDPAGNQVSCNRRFADDRSVRQ